MYAHVKIRRQHSLSWRPHESECAESRSNFDIPQFSKILSQVKSELKIPGYKVFSTAVFKLHRIAKIFLEQTDLPVF